MSLDRISARSYSNLYSSMMEKYTVNKPEYESDEDYDSEVTFDKFIGNALSDLT